MCLGNHFGGSEVSLFSLCFFCFGFCHLSFDDQTRITASCPLAWPPPGLAGSGGECTVKARDAGSLIKRLSVCPHGHRASANRSGGGQYYLFMEDSNGFSPPNNELCNLLHLPPEKGLPMACPCQVLWRKDELLCLTRDASAPGVKTQQLVWSRLVSQ